MEGDIPLPHLVRKYSENLEWAQAPEEPSYIRIWNPQLSVGCLAHCRHTTLLFLNEYFEIKDICSKNKFLLRVRNDFNLCLIKLIFQKDNDASKGLVFFPSLWTEVKMTWKQIDTRNFLKIKGSFSALCPVLSCPSMLPPTFDLQLCLQLIKWTGVFNINEPSRNNIHFTLRKLEDIFVKQLRWSFKTQ